MATFEPGKGMGPRLKDFTEYDLGTIKSWNPQQLADYFNERGYKDYEKMWHEHRVDGERVSLLTAPDIEKMGVRRVGDRVGIVREVRKIKRKQRSEERNQTVAEHKMAYDGSCWKWNLAYCCGLCPWEPDTYVLTNSVLRVKTHQIGRLCGKVKCPCLGSVWVTDTARLDRVVDTDEVVRAAGFGCCAENKCEITVAVRAGTAAEETDARIHKVHMLLNADEGSKFAQQIRETAEEWRDYLQGFQDAA